MSRHQPLASIVLAAGKGTRMKSTQAKVLHRVFYQPMLHHVLNAVEPLNSEKIIVVIGHQKQAVTDVLTDYDVHFCEQKEQNGTGHAVLSTQPLLADFDGEIMILCGDSPLLLAEHLEAMRKAHIQGGSKLTIMTTCLDDPTHYGRIIRDSDDSVLGVVEEKDATPVQRTIKEINAGIYISEAAFLFEALNQVTTDNSQGEMYLTDIVGIAVANKYSVHTFEHPYPSHVLGVNSKIELAQAHREIQSRRNRQLMAQGVTLEDPATTSVAPTCNIGTECHLAPRLTIKGKTEIGNRVRIEPGVYIKDSTIGDDVHIGANAVIIDAVIGDGKHIPPLTCSNGDKN